MSPDQTRPHPVRFTADMFLRLDREGAFGEHAKIELIDGAVLVMNAQHRRQSRLKNELVERIRAALRSSGSSLTALSEVSVVLPPDDVPEPDIVVLMDDGGDGPVSGADAKLIVEVADTTLRTDMGVKAAIYAQAEIAEYWVVDVDARRVVQHAAPANGLYTQRHSIAFGEPVTAATISGLAIGTSGL